MTSRIARHALMLLSLGALLGVLACGDTQSSDGDSNNSSANNSASNNNPANNNPANNNPVNNAVNNNPVNNNPVNNNPVNNNPVNNNPVNNNPVNNTPDPIAECEAACTNLGTTCREDFLAECPTEVVDQLIPGCQQACADENARAQITAVAALPCATVVPLAIDGFGLSDLCADEPDLCAEVTCDEGETCDPVDGECKPDAVDLCAEVTCEGGEACDPETGLCAPIACDADALEPNDSLEAATVVPAEGGSWEALTICADDTDWFRLDIPAATSMLIRARFTHAQGDLELFVVDAAGEAVTSSTSSSDDEFLVYDAQEEAATYYVRVEGYEGAINTYDFSVAFNPEGALCGSTADCEAGVCDLGLCGPCTEDAQCDFGGVCETESGACVECVSDDQCGEGESCVENSCAFICTPDADEDPSNNSSETPTALPAEALSRELSLCGEDTDWYTLTVAEGQQARVSVLFSDAIGDIDVEAYLSLEDEPISSASASDNEFLALGAGTWLVNIFGYNGAENNYTLEVSYAAAGAYCNDTEECAAGSCIDAECVSCASDADCDGGICDIETGICGEAPCTSDDDCGLFEYCIVETGACVECVSDDECFGFFCSEDNLCVECIVDEDCADAGDVCIGGFCEAL